MPRRSYRNRTGGNYYRARTKKQKGFERAVKKIAREVVLAAPEIKFLDTAVAVSDAYTAHSQVECLTLIPEGDGLSGRDGEVVKLRSVRIRGTITDVGAANAVGDVAYAVRLCMVRETNGADLTVAELLAYDGVNAMRNWDYRKDVKILKEWHGVLRKHDTVGHKAMRFFDYYKKFKFPANCTFTGTSDNVASTNNNHLFLVLSSSAADTDDPSFALQCRVTYIDP